MSRPCHKDLGSMTIHGKLVAVPIDVREINGLPVRWPNRCINVTGSWSRFRIARPDRLVLRNCHGNLVALGIDRSVCG